MGKSLEGIEIKKAAQRQKDTRFKPGHKKYPSSKDIPLPTRLPSLEVDHKEDTPIKKYPTGKGSSYEIAKRIGVSHSTYERSKKIIEKGTEEQKNLLRKGDVGIRKIYGQIKREEKRHDLIHKAIAERQQYKQHSSNARQ